MNQDTNQSDNSEKENKQEAEVNEDPVADVGEEDLAAQLEVARAEAAKNRENFLLASAEAENIRKRAENEIAQARKFAIERFAQELLSVRDSLELASTTEINSEDADAVSKMREGLELTLKQLDTVFEKFDISVVHPKGEKFNPDHHQAMAMVESTDVQPNHVVDVMQKGYLLKDRLLRPAMVVVAKAASNPGKSGPEENGESGASGA